MSIEAVIMDVKLEDATVPTAPITILARTLPRNLVRPVASSQGRSLTRSSQATGSIPIVRVGITSAVEQETGLKESKIKVLLANFTYHLTADLGWLSDVALFAKAPAGVRLFRFKSRI